MKSSFFMVVIALVAAFFGINAVPSCRREITKYTIQNLRCAENGIDIQGLITKLAQGEIIFLEIANNIESKCEVANSASCYNDISTPIEGSCNEAESVQHFRNAFKTVISFNEYMCQNNGQKYLDFVKNDGAACYYNDEKAKCYNEGKEAANLGEQPFTDANVCKILEADFACLHHYDNCKNKNVRPFYEQILMSMREKFSC